MVACESIDARAFTVGNHVAFNQGEYDPSSAEGQHVLAHELAHVRQQTQGAVSMLPQEDDELEIDPDPALEREAEEAAQRAMAGGPVTVNRMGAEVHVQRIGGPYAGLPDAVEDHAIPANQDATDKHFTPEEIAAGIEEAGLLSVDPSRFRDAYKFAEHATTLGSTQAVVQPLVSEFGLSRPEAIAVTLAVGGTIHVGKDRLHREDIYLTLEVARLLGAEERVIAFFERIGVGPFDEGESQADELDK